MVALIRRATMDESDEVAAVHRASREAAMPFLRALHTREEDRSFFRTRVFPACEVWVAHDAGIAGFIAFRGGWIDHFYVRPDRQRRGHGRVLLGKAKERHPELQLWTFQRNLNAIAFYTANGFRLVRETNGSANEEREPDALFAWSR
jgi:GNAT superfamily N-acetyltransferase